MKNSSVTMLLLSLFLPAVGDAQEIYRATRSVEEQQSISQIGQAEYYHSSATSFRRCSALTLSSSGSFFPRWPHRSQTSI